MLAVKMIIQNFPIGKKFLMRVQSANRAVRKVDYPVGDAPPMESDLHLLALISLVGSLRHHFRRKKDVFVGGNMFLFYKEGNPHARKAPDVMVAKGVEHKENRKSFKVWEEKASPSFLLELTSKETAREDLGPKKTLYESLGIREYFLFDPAHESLPEQLMGYRLVGDEYQQIEVGLSGSILSLELGIKLTPDGAKLTLHDHKTGKRLLALDDAYLRVQYLEKKLAQTQAEVKRLRKRKS